MPTQQEDGYRSVQPPFPEAAELKGQQQQEAELHHLRRLEIEAPRQGHPALVPRAVVVAQGDQQQQQAHIHHRQEPPELVHKVQDIQPGQHQTCPHPHCQGDSLFPRQAVELRIVAGGRKDQRQAPKGGRQAEEKQRPLFPLCFQ